jgi:hypothetical protein
MNNNSLSPQNIDPDILAEATTILSRHFEIKIIIESVAYLSDAQRRNTVLRLTLKKPPAGTPSTVILKQSLKEKPSDDHTEVFGRFARDWAGLEFLSALPKKSSVAPRIYGGSSHHRFVLLEDLGEVHISLVDHLLGTDKDNALRALKRYMQSMGEMHANAFNHIAEYKRILEGLNADAQVWPYDIDKMSSTIEALLNKLQIEYSPDLQNEINQVFATVKECGPFTTLIHGDICPDNVFDDPKNNQMRIFDFEWSFVGNALLDGTYLRMSNPTCWCVKRFPEDIIDPLEAIYRSELAKTMSKALDDDLYYESYVAACAYWMLGMIAWGLDEILEKENDISDNLLANLHPKWKPEDNRRWPRNLSRFQAFIDVARKHNKLPHLRSMAEQILMQLKILWPDAKPLELFPAFF